MRSILVAGLAAAGLAGVVGALPAAASPESAVATSAEVSFTPKPVTWKACTGDLKGLQCGSLQVPLDYAEPTGTKITLALSRYPHTVASSKYQGVMLVNPGGPGGEGRGLAGLGTLVPEAAGDAYDWVGFDPRGVGGSRPALACDSGYFKAGTRPVYEPATHAIESAWLAKTRAYSAACATAGGRLLDHVRTVDSVRDMDTIRKALGRTQINYYGLSYGTYLGQVYGQLFPGRLRRVVFDGVVNPSRVWYRANLDQDLAWEGSMDAFFTWVAKNDATYGLGTDEATVERRYYSLRKQLIAKPFKSFGAADWNDVFVSAGYYVYGWDVVAEEFAAAAKGDFGPAAADYKASYPTTKGSDNGYAMYLATQCTDAPWPSDHATNEATNWRIWERAPFITWNNAWYNEPCRTWKGKAYSPRTITTQTEPALLVNETKDSATPFSGALAVRKLLPKSVLVEGVGGTTHAGSLSGVTCTDDTIATYLSTGRLPARLSGDRSDVQCPPVPAPVVGEEPAVKAANATAARRAALAVLTSGRF